MGKICISELIALTLSAMKTDLKLSDDIVYRYECHGVRPMQRYFDGKDHAYYSGELADAFVDDYYVLYESGNISDRKFRYIRKSSALVKEYATTKAIV